MEKNEISSQLRNKINLKKTVIPILFFLAYFILGIFIYKDYGLSYDEEQQRKLGILTYQYIFGGNNELFDFKDKDYGVGFELPLILLEKLFNLQDPREIYFMRHFATFSFFFTSMIFFYFLCKNHFKDEKWGLIAVLFLILSPRIFADSFYNDKDIIFLAVYILAIFTMTRFAGNLNLKWAIIHGYVCSLLLNIRTAGLIIIFITIGLIILDKLKIKQPDTKKVNYLLLSSVFLSSLSIFLYITWPYLWKSPFSNFFNAFITASKFPRWQGAELFFGVFTDSNNLPPHYIPAWIIITTPILYPICAGIGIIYAFKSIFSDYFDFLMHDETKRNNLIFLCCLFLPLMSVIFLKSKFYNGWRHMFFIYPVIIIFAVEGLKGIFRYIESGKTEKKDIMKYIFTGIIIFSFGSTAFTMIKNHPFQNVYFNLIVSNGKSTLEDKFSLDYWGLSSRKALEYVLKNNPGRIINVSSDKFPGYFNRLILPIEDRNRLNFVDTDKAEFNIVENYNVDKNAKDIFHENEYYSISVDGSKIMTVYKIDQTRLPGYTAEKNQQQQNFFETMNRINPALAMELKQIQNLPKEEKMKRFQELKEKYKGFLR